MDTVLHACMLSRNLSSTHELMSFARMQSIGTCPGAWGGLNSSKLRDLDKVNVRMNLKHASLHANLDTFAQLP